MKILVTGGAGFIGSHIVGLLIDNGHRVTVMDDLSSGKRENLNPRAEFLQMSVVNAHKFTDMMDSFDAICHQAAQASLLRSVNFPDQDATINILGTLSILKLARQMGAHMVLASTSAVYDDEGPQPFTETSALRPTRPYGISKLSAEMYLRESGVRATILRYGNVYGPRQVPVGENQLVPRALAHIWDGAPFVVNGDGEQTRDFVYVGEVARANLLALTQRVTGTFNIAHGIGHSVNRVLLTLKHLTDWKGEWTHGPEKAKEPRAVALSALRAQNQLGWAALTPLVEGLGRTMAAREIRENSHA